MYPVKSLPRTSRTAISTAASGVGCNTSSIQMIPQLSFYFIIRFMTETTTLPIEILSMKWFQLYVDSRKYCTPVSIKRGGAWSPLYRWCHGATGQAPSIGSIFRCFKGVFFESY